MNYLTAADILRIHSYIIDETGGSHGLRDRGAVESVVAAPQQSFSGKKMHKTVFKKAAVYLYQIAMNHPFVDGNKRTAITAAGIFLEENSYKLSAEAGELEDFMVQVIEEGLDSAEIADWLEGYTSIM